MEFRPGALAFVDLTTCDFLVIGGGIVGVNIALEIRRRHPASKIVLLEKEPRCGAHASGRNSGVLHAGFYYAADSLKARFTSEGNRMLTQYCVSRNLPMRRCGKLVVARTAAELPELDRLLKQAGSNNVAVESVTAAEAEAIEPRAITFERALFSPSTSTIDPRALMDELVRDAEAARVEIRTDSAYLRNRENAVQTSSGNISAGFIVNAAGLYADRVAHEFGVGLGYRILPFKGLYLESDEPPETMRTHVYPVPNPEYPFLGVHATVRADGRLKIGPTALPALWREQYRGLDGFRFGEFAEIAARDILLLLSSGFGFSRLAMTEIRKSSRRRLVALAGEIVRGLNAKTLTRWGRPGIRAQLFDLRSRKLVMDFVVEGGRRSLHVLNAVSPGLTCAMPFSRFVVDRIEETAA